MKLSILICTTTERIPLFDELLHEFDKQLQERSGWIARGNAGAEQVYRKTDEVELIALCDNKEMTIGAKRQRLLELSQGEWIVFFDDDDMPASNYIDLILSHMSNSVDCMGIKVKMTTNGLNEQTCLHRLGRKWAERQEGYDYIRPIIHFNPVRRVLALKAGFKDIRFGEDRDYSDRLNRLVKKEAFIDEWLFHYRYSNKQPHNLKYGIKGGKYGRK